MCYASQDGKKGLFSRDMYWVGLHSESPNVERLASIHQTVLYVHQKRFAACEGYVKRVQMHSIKRDSIAHAMLMLCSAGV